MEKRGLGKGLGALIPGAGRDERPTSDLSIDQISLNPYQPRRGVDDEKFQELVRSVRLHGILQPVLVRASGGSSYELVAGERRLKAAAEVGLTRIPAVIKAFTDEQSLEVALIENLQREDIGVLEAAAAYKRLVEEFGLTQDEIAFRIGKSRPSIANTLRLLNLPDQIQKSLSTRQITEGHARALLAITDPERQRAIWHQTVAQQLSVRDTERLCREVGSAHVSRETTREPEPAQATRDPNLLDAEDRLRKLFGTRVSISIGKDRGRIEIEFYTEDDLTRILTILGSA